MHINLYMGIKPSETKKTYKCPDCSAKYGDFDAMLKHVEDTHSDNIPEGVTVKQYCFNRRNNKTTSYCVECKVNETRWDEERGRYNRYCDDPICKKRAREKFDENYKKKHNGQSYDMSDPKHQQEMAFARKNSGTYTFEDGTVLRYTSSYDKHFLEFTDKDYKIKGDTISECPIFFPYTDIEGKKRTYIPDYYIEELLLVIEIKDGGDNPNTHPKILAVDKENELLKDKAVVENGKYNFIKIVNKDYKDFIKLYEYLKNQHFNENGSNERFIVIPKPTKDNVQYNGPKLDFMKQPKHFENFFKRIVSKNVFTRYGMFLDTDKIPKEVRPKNEIGLILLRESNLDRYKELEHHLKIFKEFDYYYTKKYEKYLNHDYLTIKYFLDIKKYLMLEIKRTDKEIDFKAIDTLEKKLKKPLFIQTIDNIYVIIERNANSSVISDKKLKELLKEIQNVYDEIEWDNKKDKKENIEYIKIADNCISVPGCLSYNNPTLIYVNKI